MLRVNINLAIEYMTSSQNNSHPVDWTLSQQEDIKGAFFLGYILLQVSLDWNNHFKLSSSLKSNQNHLCVACVLICI